MGSPQHVMLNAACGGGQPAASPCIADPLWALAWGPPLLLKFQKDANLEPRMDFSALKTENGSIHVLKMADPYRIKVEF